MLKLLDKLSKFANGMLKYAVAATILTVALYPKFPLFKLPGSPVAVRLEDFVILATVAIWLVAVAPNIRRFLKNNIIQAVVLFWVVGLISVYAGVTLTDTVIPHIGLLHWGRRVQYMLMLFVGIYAVRKKEDLHYYIKLLLIVVVAAFFYGIAQRYFNLPIITTQNPEYARGVALRWTPGAHLVSTFAGHYDLAAFLILFFPTLYLLASSPKKTLGVLVPGINIHVTRVSLVAASGMGIWLLMQSASRISLVSYLGTACFALILAKRKKLIPVVVAISLVFAALSTNLIDRYMSIIDATFKNFMQEQARSLSPVVLAQSNEIDLEELVVSEPVPEPPPVIEDRSMSIRLNVEWPRAIRAFKKNPFTGTGYSSITLATDNGYLRMLGEVGIIGFASFFLVIGTIGILLVKGAFHSSPLSVEGHFLLGYIASIPGIFLNLVFLDLFEASKFAILFWLLAGFAIKVCYLQDNKLKNEI